MPVGVEEAAQRVPYVIIILTHSKEVATTTGVGRTTTLSSQTDWYTVTQVLSKAVCIWHLKYLHSCI